MSGADPLVLNDGGAGIVDAGRVRYFSSFIVRSMDSQVVDDVWMAAGERSLVEEGGGVAVGGGGRADARWQ